ncbi:MAG TPA: UvrD-helicase domain-containing protein [Bryobacteraceae bacterium]|nr:UvrD-helicase domain-containing protein [Bryobacteraceae bacterium]
MTDSEARARALDSATSFIVRAPAGSGKTELLIQRYLRLLSLVEAPESILAITFTRKAAAEMRSRVVEALRLARGPRPEQAHKAITYDLARAVLDVDSAAAWQLIENPARIRIQTIDSLCASIARQMPWVSGLGAMPEIIENASALYAEAARMTLVGEDNPDAIASLLLHLDNNFERVQSLVAGMLEKRDQWLRHVGAMRDQVERCLATIVEEEIAGLRASAREAGLRAEPDDWREFANELLTQDGKWRKKNALARSLEGNDEFRKRLHEARDLPPVHFPETQWRALQAIVEVLPIAVGNLRYVFRERSCTDFTELTLASLRALGDATGPTDLGLALGYRLRHVLVDEFQDTSYTQFELLEKLTQTWEPGDGRTLFLVGDPMQSIYRFRQAEVGLFLKAWQYGIGRIQPEPLTLSVNFRSGAGIIEWVNSTFATAFPAREDMAKGAVSYSAAEAAHVERAGTVSLHAFLGEAGKDEEAACVRGLVSDAPAGGSVAVLVRARSHLPAIIAELKRAGIPYQAIEIDELGQRALVQDLMALTFALLHVGDRISWLAVLRAPWCGLSLEELHAIAGGDRSATIPSLLRAEGRLARVWPVLESALGERGRWTLRQWVERTWLRLGGPACVTDVTDLENANAYFDVLEGLDRGGEIADFELFRAQVAELFAQPDTSADGAVQIMTIHKAKGLEFDTVVVPGIGSPPKVEESPLMVWHEPGEDQVLFAPIPESGAKDEIHRYLGHIDKEKARYEGVRLFYVAVTRARGALHLLGCGRVSERDGSVSAASGSFLGILWPMLEGLFRSAGGRIANPPQADSLHHMVRRLPVAWELPAPPRAVRWVHSDVETAPAPDVTFDWVSDTARHVGTVVHSFLQRIAREGSGAWTAERVRKTGFRGALLNLGVSPAEVEAASESVMLALIRMLADSRGRWVLAAHAEAASELTLSGVTDGKLVRAVIDRTFVDDAGVRWIIDYKTGTHEGTSVEAFLATEKLRYQAQLEAYARLFTKQDTRPVRLGLYFPLVANGWVEWEAPPSVARQASLFAE